MTTTAQPELNSCNRCHGSKMVYIKCKNLGTGEWVPSIISCPQCAGKGHITQADRDRICTE